MFKFIINALKNRNKNPICPVCGGKLFGAMMSSGAIFQNGKAFDAVVWRSKTPLFYAPKAISIYCSKCNWDHPLSDFPSGRNEVE
jgi:hypothetical protein